MYANVLRAGTLTDERVVRRVSANFVPTHFNNNDPTRDPTDPSAVHWKAILKQKDLQGQGIWIVGPDGKVIAGMSAEINGHPSERQGNGPGATWRANPKFADAVVELLDTTVKTFGPLAPRTVKATPLPFRGAGVRPDGGVRLVVYNRADNGLVFSVPLSADEWKTFAPPTAAAGERWTLPEAVARQFAPVLSPHGDTRFRPRPQDVKFAELKAEVEATDAKTARLRLSGRWQVDWTHDGTEHSVGAATAQGIAVYDREAKALRSLVVIFDGTYGYTTKPGETLKPQPSAAVVRWRLDGEAE
ncbi:MAG: hypothetical protein U0746_05155 [Gemmataceae bacterium]